MRSKRGITLIALIITIIVMLILVGVTINISAKSQLFTTAKDASDDYEIQVIKENLVDYQLDYYENTGKILSDETMTKLAKISKETGVDGHKFVVYYDYTKENENKEEEQDKFIFYNWKEVTVEELEKLSKIEISDEDQQAGLRYNECLNADIDGDGYLTQADYDVLNAILSGESTSLEFGDKHKYLWLVVGNLNNDRQYNVTDLNTLKNILDRG